MKGVLRIKCSSLLLWVWSKVFFENAAFRENFTGKRVKIEITKKLNVVA